MSNWAKLQEDTIQLPVFKRAKHGIHFKNNDGSITANFSGKPCHFQDTDGLWKPIDTKLIALGDGYYGCPHSKVKIHPAGTVAVAGTNYVQYTQLPSGKTGLVDNDKLVRKFSFGEQRMWVTEDGFRSEIQLNRIPTLTEARKLIATESGTLSKEYLRSLTTATDANGNVHTYSTLTAFRTWLAAAQFPVVIDPDFSSSSTYGYILGNDEDYATCRANISSYNAAGLRCGQITDYTIYRGFIKFDTSSIDDGQSISQVNLKMSISYDRSTSDFDIQIVKYNWHGKTIDGNTEEMYDACLSADRDDSIWCNTNGTSINTYYTSGNLSTAWVDKTGYTCYGIQSGEDYNNSAPTDSERVYLSPPSDATYPPVLVVTYTAGGSITPIVQYYNRLRRN